MVFLLGPTASGKSRLAMEVARKVGAEIVSMDAFQIYRGMDIGTAKPTAQDREEIPHHLLDLVDPEDSFSAADYRRAAEDVMEACQRQKKWALWVGGTGLYHRVMTEGLSAAPRTDPIIAAEIEAMSTAEMAKEIRRVDPRWSEKADLQNRRRVVRALAVWRQTGRTMSDWQRRETQRGVLAGAKCFVLMPAMEKLMQLIQQRVEKMLTEGWGEEVRKLLQRKNWEKSPGSRAIGYAEVADWVQGKMGREEVCDQVVFKTRAYAKRQLTWFRGIPTYQIIEMTSHDRLPRESVETLAAAFDS